MQVFEIYFNPDFSKNRALDSQAKLKNDLSFSCFSYQAKNIYEKKLGDLYIVGEMRNLLPQNSKLLDNLAKTVKEKYYSSPVHWPDDKALEESLKQANKFLEKTAKDGNVSWLGNLSFSVLSLAVQPKNNKEIALNFSKVGDIKILLLRPGQIIDISKNLELEEIEPYPLKVFNKTASGKLIQDDKIMILTKEVFFAQNLLEEIAKIIPFEEKKLRRFLKIKGSELQKIFGVCLLIILSKEISSPKKTIIGQQNFKIRAFFSKKILLSLIHPIKSLKKILKIGLISLSKILPRTSFFLKFLNPLEIQISIQKQKLKIFIKNKKIILILFLLLILVLLLGSLIF